MKRKNITKQSPIVSYYTGEMGFKSVCQRSLDFATGEILFMADMMDFYKVYTIEYDMKYYVPTRLKNGLGLKMLTTKSPRTIKEKERDHLYNRETRFLPEDFKVQSTFIIYGEEVAITVSREPYLGIVIKNKEVYETFKNNFFYIWNQQVD